MDSAKSIIEHHYGRRVSAYYVVMAISELARRRGEGTLDAAQHQLYAALAEAGHIKVPPKRLERILMSGAEAGDPANIRRLLAKIKGG